MVRARAVQQERGFYNALIPVRQLRKLCALDEAGERILELAVRRLGLSARAHDRILKVARTVADLDSAECVTAKHLAEAVQYRSLDRFIGSEEARFHRWRYPRISPRAGYLRVRSANRRLLKRRSGFGADR